MTPHWPTINARSKQRRDLNADYPGTDTTPQPTRPKWEAGVCTNCDHPQDEHGTRGCAHPRSRYDTCWCAVAGPGPECPNELDDVLCVWDDEVGAFIPEAGCPKHDPDVTR